MKSVGVPVPSIVHKMTQDSIDADKINQFRALLEVSKQSTVPSTAVGKDQAAVQSPKRQPKNPKEEQRKALLQDKVLKKYMQMSSVGVPAQAVVHKMKQE